MATTTSSRAQGYYSKLREMKPITAGAAVMSDHANLRTYHKIFEKVVSEGDNQGVERVAHAIVLCSRLHDQAAMQGLVPVVEGMANGGKLAGTMKEHMAKKEELMKRIMVGGLGCFCFVSFMHGSIFTTCFMPQ
jgi:hypothetical protein